MDFIYVAIIFVTCSTHKTYQVLVQNTRYIISKKITAVPFDKNNIKELFEAIKHFISFIKMAFCCKFYISLDMLVN